MSRITDTPVQLREAKRQARSFEHVRAAHQQEVAEDYVELIADLIDVTGEARSVDIAERMGVTNATVNTTLNRLIREGLVTKEHYRSVFLTDAGRAVAEMARDRHGVVRDFLLKLGIDKETAEIDAEGIEHHISAKTLSALRQFNQDR
ncbi:MAG: manganese-binding transcriptional regulator MntR [Pseudomonadota bacterium]